MKPGKKVQKMINVSGLPYIEPDDRKRMANLNDWMGTTADILSPFLFFCAIILAGVLAFYQETWWSPIPFAVSAFVTVYMRGFFRQASYRTNLDHFEKATAETIAKIYQLASDSKKKGTIEGPVPPTNLEGFIPDIQEELKFWVKKAYSSLNYGKGLLFTVGILDAIGTALLPDRMWIAYAAGVSIVFTLLVYAAFPKWRSR